MILAFSILVHENPVFFLNQVRNIRFFYPDAIIVVHFNRYFWSIFKRRLTDYCDLYNVIINPERLETQWGSSMIFDAIRSNMFLLVKYGWDCFIQLSSNELFLRSFSNGEVFELFEIPLEAKVIDSSLRANSISQNLRDFNAYRSDSELLEFCYDNRVKWPSTGLDYGRMMNRLAFELILREIQRSFSKPFIKLNYSRSEVVIPTILTVLSTRKEILIMEKLISVWYSDECNKNVVLIKGMPRMVSHPVNASVFQITCGAVAPWGLFSFLE